MKRSSLALAPLALAALASACGGSSGKTSTAAAGAGYGGGQATTSASNGDASATAASGTTAVVTTKTNAKYGAILAGQKDLTLYLWLADKGARSACTGQCAAVWPPLLTKGTPKATGAVKASLLGTTARADGTTQVTYAGHPLYYFVQDKSPAAATGQGSQGFGAGWYVLSASGEGVGVPATAATSSGSAW